MSLSVIVPVYNEEESIIESVQTNLNVLQNVKIDYELIIVNDGSSDNSKLIIDKNFGNNSKIRIIHKEKNEGIGSAIRTGIENSSKKHILFIPVDSPLSIELLNDFLKHIDKSDIIIGCRKKRKGYTNMMKFNSLVYHFIISFLFGLRIKDYNWIHMYKSWIFKTKKIIIESKGIFMLAEVLIKAKRLNLSLYEIDVDHKERIYGKPSSSSFYVIITTIKELLFFLLFRNNFITKFFKNRSK